MPTICGHKEVKHVAACASEPFSRHGAQKRRAISPRTRVCHVIFGRLSTLWDATAGLLATLVTLLGQWRAGSSSLKMVGEADMEQYPFPSYGLRMKKQEADRPPQTGDTDTWEVRKHGTRNLHTLSPLNGFFVGNGFWLSLMKARLMSTGMSGNIRVT